MDSKIFHAWLAQLEQLSPSQWEQVHSRLQQIDKHAVDRLLEGRKPLQCPHCEANRIMRWGSAHELPRYRCRTCGRTFNPLTGSPLAHLHHRSRWLSFAQCLVEGSTLRHTARQCAVHRNTALHWRRRFLEIPTIQQAPQLHGIIEADLFP